MADGCTDLRGGELGLTALVKPIILTPVPIGFATRISAQAVSMP